MTRILAIADEVDEALYGDKLYELRPDLIVSCGDLPFEYLENLVSRANVPLVYVPGNHDPDLEHTDLHWATMVTAPIPGPQGCDSVDVRIFDGPGIRVAGLGGSIRYNTGSNQHSQAEMRLRALRLDMRLRWRRLWRGGRLDVLVTHAPPLGLGDLDDDAHRGFAAFHRLVATFAPKLLVHGHVHPVSRKQKELRLGDTLVVNAVPSRLLEV
jgi:Icc-related predicted phosphoesterase